ncbi:MAG TPA: NADH-quinone oxidoreductase subunit N [Paracoccaceae bacterium]|nr:NADH-quinone oxidoreductase subunit N [Paracoccaceae bacterium]
MPIGDAAAEIAILLAAVGALLLAMFVPHRLQWLGSLLALSGIAIAAGFCASQIGEARFTFSGVMAIDGASVWSRLLILASTALVVPLVPHWLATDRRHGEYYAMLLFSTLGAMVLATAADLLQVVMGVLLSSVTGYTLAAWHRNWPISLEAGMKYFLIGALANAILAIGVMLVFGLGGASGFEPLAAALPLTEGSPLLLLGIALTVTGLAYKLGAFPAHAWLPDVTEGAPVPSAAFLTVVPKIGAAIALVRFVSLFPDDGLAVRPLIAALAITTMTLGNLVAFWQEDVRRLIGWSSVSQAGYALMAIAVVGLSPAAVPALLIFLLGYAAANLAALSAVAHLRGRTALADYAGLSTSHPWTAVAIVIAFLSLVGIPPLAGFIGKFTLFAATIDGGYWWLAAVAIANTVASLFYYLRVVAPIYTGPAGKPAAALDWATAAATGVSAFAVIIAGLAAQLVLGAVDGITLLPGR